MKPLHTALLAALLTGTSVAHAESIQPQPEPGLWHAETTTLINGEDVMAAMRAAQEAMLNSIPPEQRASVQAMMGDQANFGSETHCLNGEQAAQHLDSKTLRTELQKSLPGCNIELSKSGSSSFDISGQCDGSEGFAGDVTGELVAVNNREIRYTVNGKGEYQAVLQDAIEGMTGSYGGPTDVRYQQVWTWQAADCSAEPAAGH